MEELRALEMLWLCFFLFKLRYVLIAMEALDQLLMACHSQSIKPFVESFLHMVAKLLESGEPKLQVLGTNSVSKAIVFLLTLISIFGVNLFWEWFYLIKGHFPVRAFGHTVQMTVINALSLQCLGLYRIYDINLSSRNTWV